MGFQEPILWLLHDLQVFKNLFVGCCIICKSTKALASKRVNALTDLLFKQTFCKNPIPANKIS